jgi:hypothetical protein
MVYAKTELANLAWSRTELGGLRFESSMKPLEVFWLYLSGGRRVVCSLGLLYPGRRFADAVPLRAAGGPIRRGDRAVRRRRRGGRGGAAGEEIGDLFGLDVDIAF